MVFSRYKDAFGRFSYILLPVCLTVHQKDQRQRPFEYVTLSALPCRVKQIRRSENSVDLDETARNEASHLDLHCLLFCL